VGPQPVTAIVQTATVMARRVDLALMTLERIVISPSGGNGILIHGDGANSLKSQKRLKINLSRDSLA
jgi:hypothetical protein